MATPPPVADDDGDRISELPDDVLEHMLSFLPAHDAVRTSLLSRSWRHLWRSAPALRVTGVKGWRSADTFARYVDTLLRLRSSPHAPPVDAWHFDFRSSDFDFDNSWLANEGAAATEQLRGWIHRAVGRNGGVRELHFSPWDHDDYSFEFVERVVPRPWGYGYLVVHLPDDQPLLSHRLTTLTLSRVRAGDAVLNLSSCPSLLNLNLSHCDIDAAAISSPSLKHLSIVRCLFSRKNSRTGIFSLPSLVSLELSSFSGWAPSLGTMPMPSLAAATVRVDSCCGDRCTKGGYGGDCDYKYCDGCIFYYRQSSGDDGSVLLNGLTEVTTLDLSAGYKGAIINRDLEWSPIFNKLKTLVLSDWSIVADNFSALTYFLRYSPVLEKLTLQFTERWYYFLMKEGDCNVLENTVASDYLKTVEIKCEEGNNRPTVPKVLEILNACGIKPEQIDIQYTPRRYAFSVNYL